MKRNEWIGRWLFTYSRSLYITVAALVYRLLLFFSFVHLCYGYKFCRLPHDISNACDNADHFPFHIIIWYLSVTQTILSSMRQPFSARQIALEQKPNASEPYERTDERTTVRSSFFIWATRISIHLLCGWKSPDASGWLYWNPFAISKRYPIYYCFYYFVVVFFSVLLLIFSFTAHITSGDLCSYQQGKSHSYLTIFARRIVYPNNNKSHGL